MLNHIDIDVIQKEFEEVQEKGNESYFIILINSLTLKCIHKKECVRRFSTPIDDRMGHLNDGLYILIGLQCGLYVKK